MGRARIARSLQSKEPYGFGFLLVLMAGLALTIWLRPVAQPGQPVIIGEPGGRALLTVDGDTPMLRLEAGQASVQLSARPDGTAVLLLSDGVRRRQAILDAQGLRLQQAWRVIGLFTPRPEYVVHYIGENAWGHFCS